MPKSTGAVIRRWPRGTDWAEARRAVGVVVFCGVIFATLLTLFVVPAAYVLLARGSKSHGHVSRLIRQEREAEARRA